jgi:hypothetical protein
MHKLALAAFLMSAIPALSQCGSTGSSAGCADDRNGVQGGTATFDLSVSDTAFSPSILKAENLATTTLTLTNTGTRPHGFAVQCIATANGNGCPTTSCFPDSATIPLVAPNASATTTFTVPNPEGIYDFGSGAPGDTMAGQFIVQ